MSSYEQALNDANQKAEELASVYETIGKRIRGLASPSDVQELQGELLAATGAYLAAVRTLNEMGETCGSDT
tara:strand:+ start:836 stop:1048 length:213 start_codon:yes stop_codon:yes gene_type:complete